MKHLIPEFDALRARFPAGFESSLVLPCLRRIQEERGYIADDDIAECIMALEKKLCRLPSAMGRASYLQIAARKPAQPKRNSLNPSR